MVVETASRTNDENLCLQCYKCRWIPQQWHQTHTRWTRTICLCVSVSIQLFILLQPELSTNDSFSWCSKAALDVNIIKKLFRIFFIKKNWSHMQSMDTIFKSRPHTVSSLSFSIMPLFFTHFSGVETIFFCFQF